MISYLGSKQFWFACALSALSVGFVLKLYSVPPGLVFLGVLMVLIVSWGANLSSLFVFLTLTLSVSITAPNGILSVSSLVVPAKYVSLTSNAFLVSLMGFIAGRCFCKKLKSSRESFYGLVFACIVSAVLFRDPLLYERWLFMVVLLLLCFGFVNIGATDSRFQKMARWEVLSFLLILITIATVVNYPRGKHLQKVGIIECFSEWGEMKTPYGTSNLGIQSGYSYSLMKEVLQRRYPSVSISDQKLLKEELSDVAIAILVTPTMPIDTESKTALEKFVLEGGRLVLIADHTDLYGHARVLNQFLGNAGISVNYDALFRDGDFYAKLKLANLGLWSVRPKTPCSLKASWDAVGFGWGDNWISESADYSRPNFFGEMSWTSDDFVGTWPVGALIKRKQGTIVVWGDSTALANFCIFQPGNLRLLGMLLEGGEPLAALMPYCAVLLICSLLVLWSKRLSQTRSVLYLSCALAVSSGGYYHWDFNPEKFYPVDKRLDVYCDSRLLDEPPPGRMPQEGGISSIYSHIPRCGLWPYYRGEVPEKPSTGKSIWVTPFNQLNRVNQESLSSLSGVMINSVLPDDNEIPFDSIYIEDTLAEPMKDLFLLTARRRVQYVTRESKHTLLHRGVPLFAAHGVVTDTYFGDWWIVTDVSPYRQFMLKEVLKWVDRREDISRFNYPEPGLEVGSQEWDVKFEGSAPVKKKMAVHPYEKDPRFVYLGSGLWALYEKTAEGEFLVGGPETSDNWLKSGNMRWAAKSMKANLGKAFD